MKGFTVFMFIVMFVVTTVIRTEGRRGRFGDRPHRKPSDMDMLMLYVSFAVRLITVPK